MDLSLGCEVGHDLRFEVKQGVHPDPLEGFGGAVHVGYEAHKGVVCPA
jgi:hypothetical protein